MTSSKGNIIYENISLYHFNVENDIIDLSGKYLTYINENIYLFPNLQILNCSYNNLNCLPNNFEQLQYF